jgi:hypothetical protein
MNAPSRSFQGGGSRSSRTRDGMRWTLMRQRRTVLTRTAKSCGPDTLTPVSSWRRQTADDGGKRARLTGESTKETVKPLRGECRVISGVTVVTTLVCFLFCTQGCGCIERPAFPAPSGFIGRDVLAKLGRIASREYGIVSQRHCEEHLRRSNPASLTSAKKAGLLRLCSQ